MVGIRTLFLHVLHVVQTRTEGKKGRMTTTKKQMFCSIVFGDMLGQHTRA